MALIEFCIVSQVCLIVIKIKLLTCDVTYNLIMAYHFSLNSCRNVVLNTRKMIYDCCDKFHKDIFVPALNRG